MNYITQNKSPEWLLQQLGFEKAPDKGYQIVILGSARKPNPYDYRTLIPRERVHATFFESRLNIHYDHPIKKRRHKTNQRHEKVITLINKIKAMDKIINERLIKVSSRLPFPKDILLGDDITITFGNNEHTTFIINCVKTEDMDNQDGTINRIYTLKYLGE